MNSKFKALSQLRKNLRSGRSEEIPMKKVSVIAPTEKGLKEGLKKAEEILPKIDKMMPEMESPEMEQKEHESEEMEGMENEESENEEYSCPSDEELNSMSREDLLEVIKKLK